MGWWPSGHGTGVIGDTPVDIVGKALQSLEKDKWTFSEILAGAIFALKESKTYFQLKDSMPPIVIKPQLDLGNSVPVHEIVTLFKRLFKEISEIYMQSWGRKPELQEILDVLAFKLRPIPRDWLASGQNTLLDDIIANEPQNH